MSPASPDASPGPPEPPPEPVDPSTRALASSIRELEALEAKAKTRRGRNLWVAVSRVGTLGWLLALSIIGGALLGHLLDLRLGTGLTFALAGLVLGLSLAGFALWRHARELES